MRKLIVSADDFGLAKSVNEGIAKACSEGIVTSLGLLATGEAFEDAVRTARSLGVKEIGAHISLTETDPLSKGGRFYKNHAAFFLDLFLGKVSPGEIRGELKSQLDRIRSTGLEITNLSSHEHIHMMPAILDILVSLAKEYGIPAMRCLRSEDVIGRSSAKKIYRSLVLACFTGRMARRLKGAGIAVTDNFMGFLDFGNITEETLLAMVASLKDGTTELVAHPGFLGPKVIERYRSHINCETELYALTSPRVKKLIKEQDIRLAGYSEMLKSGAEGEI